jgi:DNA-directed RNA polymerase subunit E'/Rpb7
MFELVAVEDCVRIAPKSFRKPYFQAITDEIDAHFANKVSISSTRD